METAPSGIRTWESPAADRYLERIYDARSRGLELAAEGTDHLYRAYARLVEDLTAERVLASPGGRMTAERARGLRASLSGLLDDFTADLEAFQREEVQGWMERLATAHAEATSEAVGQAGAQALSYDFDAVPRRALENMSRRRGLSETFRSLVGYRTSQTAESVDDYLRSAVGRGISSRRGAREIAKMMTEGDPILRQYLDPAFRRQVRAAGELGEEAERQLKRAAELRYNANRIVVTETNTAYLEADRGMAEESPVVRDLRWTLSTRHHTVPSSPDVCDQYAAQDLYGRGAGVYPPEAFPTRPHPFCACLSNYVLRPPEEWDQPPPSFEAPEVPEPEQLARQMTRDSGLSYDDALSVARGARVAGEESVQAALSRAYQVGRARWEEVAGRTAESGAAAASTGSANAGPGPAEGASGGEVITGRLRERVRGVADEGLERIAEARARRDAASEHLGDGSLEAADRFTAAVSDLTKTRKQAKRALTEALEVDGDGDWQPMDPSNWTKNPDDLEEARRYIGRAFGRQNTNVRLQQTDKDRAFNRNGTSYLNADSRGHTLVHEYGHQLESDWPLLRRRAQEHLRRRTEGEEAVRLRDLTGDDSYKPTEVTKPNGFFNPYVGRIYSSGGTEITSMALERFYQDPLKLLEDDPRLFDFLLDQIEATRALNENPNPGLP